jgi:multimeric flavodoxin WrbA
MSQKQRAIAIIGSYRAGGAVDSAVAEILSHLQDREVDCRTVYLKDYNIGFCTNCRTCLQQPGISRGKCILNDDMEEVLGILDSADFLILGAPTNAGNANALTRKFLERCVCYAYWPWGTHSPVLRKKIKSKKSILISSSAAPALIGKYLNGTLGALRTLSEYLGARPVGNLWIGGVTEKKVHLSPGIRKKAGRLAEKLAEK